MCCKDVHHGLMQVESVAMWVMYCNLDAIGQANKHGEDGYDPYYHGFVSGRLDEALKTLRTCVSNLSEGAITLRLNRAVREPGSPTDKARKFAADILMDAKPVGSCV